MYRALIAATVLTALIGCREGADQPANNGAANAAVPAAAQASVLGAAISGDEAKKVMHDRHEGMEDIGDAMKAAVRTLDGDSPDIAEVRSSAATIHRLAPQLAQMFPAGTGPETAKTEAKAEIWQKPDDFHAKLQEFVRHSAAFNAAAQGEDLAAIRAARAELGKSCKGCHDSFRAKDND